MQISGEAWQERGRWGVSRGGGGLLPQCTMTQPAYILCFKKYKRVAWIY